MLASAFSAAVSHIAPTPAPLNVQAWAYKNTALAANTLLLAATAEGLASTPMEGFDERRVKDVLHVPGSYGVPMLVALGYPAPSDPSYVAHESPRFPLSDLTRRDVFDGPGVQ
jgi:nitroreductase